MIRLVLLSLFLTLTAPVAAQAARISTGEHGDFTRIVVELDRPADWTLGRSADGYVLRLSGPPPRWDLSAAFVRINRQRIATIWADPSDAMLRIGVGCACHAIPFEFRPGTIVIDLRDGPPPRGSSFEMALEGGLLPALAAETRPPRPRARATAQPELFDWRDMALGGRWSGNPAPQDPVADMPSLQAQMMRERLLQEFSRAAGQGLVDPVARLPNAPDRTQRSAGSQQNLRIGSPLVARDAATDPPALSADGQTCPDDDRFAVADWGDGRPASLQLVSAAADLTGEFDLPDAMAVEKAVKLHLYLGFGAEASALLSAFPTDGPDVPFWRSMARIVDGWPDPKGAFAGLSACDGSVALWAALADPSLPQLIHRQAVTRSFSALPAQLRRHLGPILAEALLRKGDLETANAIGEAVDRLPGPQDDAAAILSARLAKENGDLPKAEQVLQPVLADPGPDQRAALIALVHLHAAEARPLGSDTLPSLQAYLTEAEGTLDEGAVRAAVVLAAALSDQFDLAFAMLDQVPETAPALWQLLSRAPDSAILLHAVGTDPNGISPDIRKAIADRIAQLGFLAEAQRWAGDTPLIRDTQPPQTNLPRQILARDWAAMPEDAPDFWRLAADRLEPAARAQTGPLGHGRTLVTNSQATRIAIEDLLRNVPTP